MKDKFPDHVESFKFQELFYESLGLEHFAIALS